MPKPGQFELVPIDDYDPVVAHQEFLDMAVALGEDQFMPRNVAAAVLTEIANQREVGGFPVQIDMTTFARSVIRITGNARFAEPSFSDPVFELLNEMLYAEPADTEAAVGVFREVADHGSFGSFPEGVTAKDLAASLALFAQGVSDAPRPVADLADAILMNDMRARQR